MSKVTQPQKNLQTFEQDLAKRNLAQNILGSEEFLDQNEDEQALDQEDLYNNNILPQSEINNFPQNNEQPYQEEDQIPTHKDQLLEYIKDKLSNAEMTMANLYVAIEIERQKREILRAQFEEKKRELDDFNEAEGEYFKGKVQTRITPALQRALEDRVFAENERIKLEEDLKEREELDDTSRMLHREKCQREIDADDAQYRINEQESTIDNYNIEIGKLLGKNNTKDNEINELTAEINDMKSVVETLILTQASEEEGGYYNKSKERGSFRKEEGQETGRSFDKTISKDSIPKEDDFWYAEVLAQKKLYQQKKGNQEKSHPWQPKVHDYNKTLQQREDIKTIQYNTSLPTIKLPSLLHREKAEILHKNQEFIDEFTDKTKTKNGKDKTNKTYKIIYNKKKSYEPK